MSVRVPSPRWARIWWITFSVNLEGNVQDYTDEKQRPKVDKSCFYLNRLLLFIIVHFLLSVTYIYQKLTQLFASSYYKQERQVQKIRKGIACLMFTLSFHILYFILRCWHLPGLSFLTPKYFNYLRIFYMLTVFYWRSINWSLTLQQKMLTLASLPRLQLN